VRLSGRVEHRHLAGRRAALIGLHQRPNTRSGDRERLDQGLHHRRLGPQRHHPQRQDRHRLPPTESAIIVRSPGSATIDHVDIAGVDAGAHDVQYAVLSQTARPVTISHSNQHNRSNCIQGDYVIATDNHTTTSAAPAPDAHLDGILCISDRGCHLTATHNTVLSKGIAIALYGDFGIPVDSTINNIVGGRSYTLYGGTSKSSNIRITDNRISRAIHPDGGIWGPLAYFWPHHPGNTFTGNIWDDTGRP
jgi:hypothetical protein